MDSRSDAGSVSQWLGALKAGELQAAQPLFNRYFTRLIGRVRAQLIETRAARAERDEEDVALSAIDSVFDGIGQGRFPRLDDRDDLWRILVAVSSRKVIDEVRRQKRGKRNGGRLVSEAGLAGADGQHDGLDGLSPTDLLYHAIHQDPTPELAAIMAEEYARRQQQLADPLDRRIAELKLAGYTNDEIAEQLDRSLRTVTLHLRRIRKTWQTMEVP
jgi:DNA-directed RNA polymerase specialized sigma24 family protein